MRLNWFNMWFNFTVDTNQKHMQCKVVWNLIHTKVGTFYKSNTFTNSEVGSTRQVLHNYFLLSANLRDFGANSGLESARIRSRIGARILSRSRFRNQPTLCSRSRSSGRLLRSTVRKDISIFKKPSFLPSRATAAPLNLTQPNLN